MGCGFRDCPGREASDDASTGWVGGKLGSYLGKLSPGGEVCFLLHLNVHHVDLAFSIWHKGIFTGILAVIQNFRLTEERKGEAMSDRKVRNICIHMKRECEMQEIPNGFMYVPIY